MKNTLKFVGNGLVPVYETSTGTELYEVLGEKSNYRDWVKNRLNDFDAVDEPCYFWERETIECRKKNLYRLTAESANSFGESQTSTLHWMYCELEERLGIVLDSYKAVYRSETGRYGADMVEVIAANDRIYELAVEMNMCLAKMHIQLKRGGTETYAEKYAGIPSGIHKNHQGAVLFQADLGSLV